MLLINTIQALTAKVAQGLYPQQEIDPVTLEITPATNSKFGHYQCNGAMRLTKLLGKPPRAIAEELATGLLRAGAEMFAKVEIAGPGFINFTLSEQFISNNLNQIKNDDRVGCAPVEQKLRVVIDFSSPNIAKEMHVGHLRSTIIGDCIARVLEFVGHDVLRLNHVGDWGTQFGMLIAYLRREQLSMEQIEQMNLQQLVRAYKDSKLIFDSDEQFKNQAQLAVVALQSGDEQTRQIWQIICAISRHAFEEVYRLLDIKLLERGESFYNPYLPGIITDLEQKGLLTISEGAKCVNVPGFENREGEPLPLIVQKSDGGFNYATTDIAAVRHRVENEHGQWLIYVTDAGQAQHFAMVFAACRMAGYYDPSAVRVDHVPFGLVLRADGKKFKTRSGDTERLIDLLRAAVDRAAGILQERQPEIDLLELVNTAEILGINAVKYADLANNRVSDYSFSLDKMLQFEGNTAAFVAYAYVRIQSIKRKIGTNIQQITGSIILQTEEEIALGLQLLQFADVLHNFCHDLMPNRITEYLFELSSKFHTFFHNCRVEGSEQQDSRLLLCDLTGRVLAKGLDLLGLRDLERM